MARRPHEQLWQPEDMVPDIMSRLLYSVETHQRLHPDEDILTQYSREVLDRSCLFIAQTAVFTYQRTQEGGGKLRKLTLPGSFRFECRYDYDQPDAPQMAFDLDQDGASTLAMYSSYVVRMVAGLIQQPFQTTAQLESSFVHEFYHAHQAIVFPVASETSRKHSGRSSKDVASYVLDHGEQAARLYAIQYLRQRVVDPNVDLRQRVAFLREAKAQAKLHAQAMTGARNMRRP